MSFRRFLRRLGQLFLAALLVATTVSVVYFPMAEMLHGERAERERLEGILSSQAQAPAPPYDADRIAKIIELLSRYSVYDLPEGVQLTEAMVEAIVASTGDRYAEFFNDLEYAEYQLKLSGKFVGIGVTAVASDGGIEILFVHSGSPAEGKLLPGDIITALDGQRVSDMGYDAAIDAMAGEVGTEVSLSFLRDGAACEATILRGEVVKQTVISKTVSDGGKTIGYVMITGFDGHTYEQFRAAVSAHEAAGVDAMLFDLRNNGGGLLSSIANILAYILPDGVIAHIDYASDAYADYSYSAANGYLHRGTDKPVQYDADGGHQIDCPMAVLVNGRTASAAELFTSAIRDYASAEFGYAIKAKIVGETTYGKGTVQSTYSVGNTGLKMTIAHYNPPCNISYDGIGILPDVAASLPQGYENLSLFKLDAEHDTQMAAAISALLAMLAE